MEPSLSNGGRRQKTLLRTSDLNLGHESFTPAATSAPGWAGSVLPWGPFGASPLDLVLLMLRNNLHRAPAPVRVIVNQAQQRADHHCVPTLSPASGKRRAS